MQSRYHCSKLGGIVLLLVFLGVQLGLSGTSYHIRTNGSSSGTGSSASAWSLDYALSGPSVVKPGDTLWVHGGTYQGHFTSNLNGTASLPIVVRQYPGERAIINGGTDTGRNTILSVAGTYTWFWGFEIWSSDQDRVSSQATAWPTDISMGDAIATAQSGSSGTGCKFINMYIHDTSQGFGLWVQAQNLEVYGCQILFNGWSAPNMWGHAIYIQNQNGNKTVQDNIIYGNLGYGIHAYTGMTEYLNNLTFQGNAIVANGYDISSGQGKVGSWVGGSGTAPNLVFKSNCMYLADNSSVNTNANFGLAEETHQNAVIDSNCFVGGDPCARVDGWNTATIRANRFAGKGWWAEFYPKTSYGNFQWNYNTYNGLPSGADGAPLFTNGSAYSFSGWKSTTGQDASSIASSSAPTGTQIYVRPNRYEPGRAHVVVYNWSNAAQVTVSAASLGLADGSSYRLVNVQNMEYIKTGTVSGGQVTIPMSGWATPAKPNGTSTPAQDLLPRFGAFLVMGTAGSAPPQDAPALSVTPDSRSVSSAAGTTTFSVANSGTGTMAWAASSNQSWATITDGGSGSNGGTISVSYTANTSTSTRTATITITASGAAGNPKQVTITQAAATLSSALSVAPASASVGSGTGSTSFSVSNTGGGTMAWTAVSNQSWATIAAGNSGSNSGTINVTCAANTSTSTRTATITVTASGATGSPKQVTITQAAATVSAALSVTPGTVSVSAASGSTSFSVANSGGGTMTWTASSDQSWATITSGASGTNGGTISVSYQSNGTTSSRTATITVTASGASGSPARVTIVQARKNKRHIRISSISAASISPTSVVVTWQAVADVDSTSTVIDTSSPDTYSFEVQRATNLPDRFLATPNGVITGNETCPDSQQLSYKDTLVPEGTIYYRVKWVDFDGSTAYSQSALVNVTTGTAGQKRVPTAFALGQNYPNPFNPSTTISFDLPSPTVVRLTVYNQLGQEVANLVSGYREAGTHSVVWDAASVASGVYFYRITAGEYTATRQLVLLK